MSPNFNKIGAGGKFWYYDRYAKIFRNVDDFYDEISEDDLRLMVFQESASNLEDSIDRLCDSVNSVKQSPIISIGIIKQDVIELAKEKMGNDSGRIDDEKDESSDRKEIKNEHEEYDKEQAKSDAQEIDSYEEQDGYCENEADVSNESEFEQQIENESFGYENEDESYEYDQQEYENQHTEYDEELNESEDGLGQSESDDGSDLSDDSDLTDYMEGEFDKDYGSEGGLDDVYDDGDY